MSMTGTPSARSEHTAVWSGSRMLIWGGFSSTGATYDPAVDLWTAMTTVGAPAPRGYHTAVWTGSEMVVWGGWAGDDLDTGGRWLPPTCDAPVASSNSPVCAGGDIQLSASTIPGATYTWTGPYGFTSVLQNPVIPAAPAWRTGTYQVVASVAGCTSAPASTTVAINACSSNFWTVTPCRVIDTRWANSLVGGPSLQSGQSRVFPAPDWHCGVGPTASALALNVTVTNPSAAGFLTLFPAGQPLPSSSVLNFRQGQTRANNLVLPIGSGIAVFCGIPSTGTVDVIVDVTGYFD